MHLTLLADSTVTRGLKTIISVEPHTSPLQSHTCSQVILSGIFKATQISEVTNQVSLKPRGIWHCLQLRQDQVLNAGKMQKENVAVVQAGRTGSKEREESTGPHSIRNKSSHEPLQRTEASTSLYTITIPQFFTPSSCTLKQYSGTITTDRNICLKSQAPTGNVSIAGHQRRGISNHKFRSHLLNLIHLGSGHSEAEL